MSKHLAALLAAAALSLLGASEASAQRALFNAAANAPAAAADAARLQSLRAAPVSGAVGLFNADLSALADDSVAIALPEGGAVLARHTRTDERSASDRTWYGAIDGGSAILVVQDNGITGSLRVGGDLYRITPLSNGLHAVAKVDWSRLPPGQRPLMPPAAAPANAAQVSPAAANTTVDILVAFTTKAAAKTSNLASFAQLSVDETNQAYVNSQIAVTLRLVGTMQVNYTENGNHGGACAAGDVYCTALRDMTDGTISDLAAVHTKRDQLGADLVSMFIDDTTFCGIAWLNATASIGYSVVGVMCEPGTYSFGHEIGHNFGAVHDPVTEAAQGNSTPPFPYGYGFVNPSKTWHDIMAYASACNNCPVIPYFSNPDVTFPGPPSPAGPTGTTDKSNVARVHNERAATIAAFRATVDPNAPLLVSSVLPTSRSVQFNTTATAFQTTINAGKTAATACGLSAATALISNFSYQTTDSSTNKPTGNPNTPADIPAGGSQSYVFSITPQALFSSNIQINTNCTNANLPATIPGVSTLLLTSSSSPTPDIVALAASTDPGFVDLPTGNPVGAFSVASVNVGISGAITVSADTGGVNLPVTITLCQTNSSAQCMATPAATTTLTIGANATPTFSVFVLGSKPVADDPATNRVFVRFKDSGGNTRGSTSVAVRTK